MTTPVVLMAGVLAFWGWQTGLLYVGVIMGVVLEGSRWVKVKWEFSMEDVQRIWSLCTLLFLGATVVSFVSNDGADGLMGLVQAQGVNRTEALNATTRSVLVLLQWLPLVVFPMMAAQAFGQSKAFDARAFSWILRRRHEMTPGLPAPPSFNVSYPYVMVCLASASTSNLHRELFYVALAVVMGWTLWGLRSNRFSMPVWVSVFLIAGLLGFGGQLGLRQLQGLVRQLDAYLVGGRAKPLDRGSTVTEMGSVGRLKMSGRIVLRVDPETNAVPELLREVSYNEFKSPSIWYSSKKPFEKLTPGQDRTVTLLPDKPASGAVRISRRMSGKGRGLLALPIGTSQVEGLDESTILRTNVMGVMELTEGPGVVSYLARFGPGATADAVPEAADLLVPIEEKNAVVRVATELNLTGLSEAAKLATVKSFFLGQFQYTTYLEGVSVEGMTPMADFLLNTREGHCEYFAAASVFILREAGIPARYAVGYSVQEKKGDRYVVRGRHAHAWCLAFVDGNWINFDATPGSWNGIESQKAGFWEPISDFFSDIWFAFSRWRWSEQSIRGYLPWLLVPPIAVVVYRLVARRQWRRARSGAGSGMEVREWPGTDSEFYQVERALLGRGLGRGAGETIRSWVERVREANRDSVRTAELEKIVSLHYRYRFHPAGLESDDREGLRVAVQVWLERQKE